MEKLKSLDNIDSKYLDRLVDDSPDWIRHGKFVKINPTNKMITDYDVKQ